MYQSLYKMSGNSTEKLFLDNPANIRPKTKESYKKRIRA